MTRRVIAIEGKRTRDGRFINPGAIEMKRDVIPVMTFSFTIVGKATDFNRNEETGEISLDINMIEGTLPDDVNVHISLYNLEAPKSYDKEPMIIESGILANIYISLGESAWPELSYKKAKQ